MWGRNFRKKCCRYTITRAWYLVLATSTAAAILFLIWSCSRSSCGKLNLEVSVERVNKRRKHADDKNNVKNANNAKKRQNNPSSWLSWKQGQQAVHITNWKKKNWENCQWVYTCTWYTTAVRSSVSQGVKLYTRYFVYLVDFRVVCKFRQFSFWRRGFSLLLLYCVLLYLCYLRGTCVVMSMFMISDLSHLTIQRGSVKAEK